MERGPRSGVRRRDLRSVISDRAYSGMLARSTHMRSTSKPSHASCMFLMRLGRSRGWG